MTTLRQRLIVAALAALAAVLFHHAMMADKASLCAAGTMTIEEC